jgi:molecular chaperone GrpE
MSNKKDVEKENLKEAHSKAIIEEEEELSDEDEMSFLREVNITLNEDLEFYKAQLETANEKLRVINAANNDGKLAQLDAEAKLKEIQLDYENLKKRATVQKEAAEIDGVIKSVKALLPAIDAFRRAITTVIDEKVNEGLRMIYRQIVESLSRLGVEEIPALGTQFDPDIHNAVMQVDVKDPTQSGLVVEVFQKGYYIGDRIIRYSQVKVAK